MPKKTKKVRKPCRRPTRTQPPRACKRTHATAPDQHDERVRSMAKKKIRKPYRKPTRTQPPRACKRTYATVPDQHDEQCLSLEQLPDDVLLVVMQHLDVDALLACRLVCRRLGALALQPDAWRHRSLSTLYSEGENRLTCPVLRLAPCLHHMTVVAPLQRGMLKSVCGHLHTTRCAAGGLEVRDVYFIYHAGAFAARLIQHQATLGRLKRVAVKYGECTISAADIPTLFGTLMSTPGLEEIRLHVNLHDPFELSMCGQLKPVPSSIRRLHVGVKGADPFVQFVLQTHAATVEEVHFLSCWFYFRLPLSILHLLAGLPCLRELTIHRDQPGLGVLAKCGALRTLNIMVGYWDDDGGGGGVERLRRARPGLQVKIHKRTGARDEADH